MIRSNRVVAVVSAFVMLVALSGCGSSSTATSPTPTPVETAPYSQTDIVVGTGTEATAGRTLTVNYTGWLYDSSKPDNKGTQFGTSVGGTPYTFTLGLRQVIAGWDQGVQGMKVGGIRRLVIPASLAYGSTGSGTIPPNATIVFDIELLSAN